MKNTMTVKEYAESIGKTKEAVFYQIKKGTIEAKKNKNNQWEIIIEKEILVPKKEFLVPKKEKKAKKNKSKKQDKEANNKELLQKITHLQKELELQKSIIATKDEVIKSKNQTIEAEQRTNVSLMHNLKEIETKKDYLALENKKLEEKVEEIKIDNLIPLNEYLDNSGFNSKKKKNIRKKFNSRLGKENRIIKIDGYFYLKKGEYYKDLIY